MTVEDHGAIDFVTYYPATDDVVLVMVEQRDWGTRGALLPDLERKVETYLRYVADGKLVHDYPAVAGRPVRIELRCAQPPTEREEQFIDIVNGKHLVSIGLSIAWKPLSSVESQTPS